MANVVRSAIIQTEWTGDVDSMVKKNADYARQAAEQGAKVLCFQELFYGPYFCQVQDDEHFGIAEPIPDGKTTKAMMDLAKETEMVLIVLIFEKEDDGFFYNTAAVIERDGTYLGKYRKTHIPHVSGFGRSTTSGLGTPGTRSSTPRSGASAYTSVTTVTFPRAGGRWASTAPRSCSTRRRRAVGSRCISGISSSLLRRSPTSTS